ncbi:MAG: transglutaminase-like cysteine peptidase [Alphaproteobacteria bacterium]
MSPHSRCGAAAALLAALFKECRRGIFLALAFVVSATAAASGTHAAEPALPPLFGAREKPLEALAAFAQWKAVLARYGQERAQALAACTPSRPESCREAAWRGLLSHLADATRMAQLTAVNSFVNATPYVGEPRLFGPTQRWATPREFLQRGGECMDFVIAKYFSLREMGVPAAALRIVVVHDRALNIGHAVLAVYDRYDWFILDNQDGNIWWSRIIGRYVPIYALNEAHAWLLQKVGQPYANDLAQTARLPNPAIQNGVKSAPPASIR